MSMLLLREKQHIHTKADDGRDQCKGNGGNDRDQYAMSRMRCEMPGEPDAQEKPYCRRDSYSDCNGRDQPVHVQVLVDESILRGVDMNHLNQGIEINLPGEKAARTNYRCSLIIAKENLYVSSTLHPACARGSRVLFEASLLCVSLHRLFPWQCLPLPCNETCAR